MQVCLTETPACTVQEGTAGVQQLVREATEGAVTSAKLRLPEVWGQCAPEASRVERGKASPVATVFAA